MAGPRLTPGALERARPAVATAMVVALLLALARFGYFRIFSLFVMYDDEGYVMQTIRSYLSGAPLYDAVFSQYGPGFYVFAWVMHGLLGVPLTHDAVRLVTIVWWLAGAGLGAAIVYRLTRSLPITALATILVFGHLSAVINEPGHPQAILAVVVLLSCALLPAGDARPTTSARAAACGALAAFAALVKVNVGVYLILGLLLPLVIASPLPAFVQIATLAATVVAPFAILGPHLRTFALPYGVGVAAGVLGVAIAAFRRVRGTIDSLRPLIAFCVAGAVTGVALTAPALIGGTSIGGLVRGTITEPSRLRLFFVVPLVLPPWSIALAAVSVAACVAVTCVPAIADSAVVRWLIALLGLSALWLVTSGAQVATLIALLTPLLWLPLVLPPSRLSGGQLFARMAVATVAAIDTLQAYPVAGSQLAFASAVTLVLAITAIDDAFETLAGTARPAFRLALRVVVLGCALQAARPVFGFGLMKPRYLANVELRLPGASRVRLPPAQVAAYQWLAATTAASCSTALTLPGLYSINSWSGVPPPTHANVTAWHTLLSSSEQQRVWAALDAAPQPCVIVQPALAVGWTGGVPLERLDVGPHLAGHPTLAEADGYDFLLPQGRDVRAMTVELMRGQQVFGPGRTPMPLNASFLQSNGVMSLRLWFRTRNRGVVLGCEAHPLVAIDADGTLRSVPVADDAWHHVVLVRATDYDRWFVDGTLLGTFPAEAPGTLTGCAVGPTPFSGEVVNVGVSRSAWDESRVAADRQRTHP